jgi:VAD1 Analog of StAR-related lipid transfer domain
MCEQLSGIPYADYFTVHSLWSVTAKDSGNSTVSTSNETSNAVDAEGHAVGSVSSSSKLTIKLWVQFTADTWLKGKVVPLLILL